MRTWVAAGMAGILMLLVLPERALASLDGANSGASATARFTGDDDEPTITSLPDSLSLTLSSAASETYTPAFGPWLDDFEYQATILGRERSRTAPPPERSRPTRARRRSSSRRDWETRTVP